MNNNSKKDNWLPWGKPNDLIFLQLDDEEATSDELGKKVEDK